MAVGDFEHGIEPLQYVAVAVLQTGIRIQHVQDGFVILVDKHYRPTARLFVSGFKYLHETSAPIQLSIRRHPVLCFPVLHITVQALFQYAFLHEVRPVEIYMEHRMYVPFLLQLLDGQSLEQFLMSQVVVLQGRHQQALPESPGAAQEIDTTFVCQVINHRGLVYIGETILNDTFETLYADRVFHVI